jgi:hypothetical protein
MPFVRETNDPATDDALLAAERRGRRLAIAVLVFWWLLAALVIVSVVVAHPTADAIAILMLGVLAPPALLWATRWSAVITRPRLRIAFGALAMVLFFASLGLAFLAVFAVGY